MLSPTEIPLAAIVENAGGIYVGIQKGDLDLNLGPLVLFQHPVTGTTLAVKLNDLTEAAVRQRLLDASQKWHSETRLKFNREYLKVPC